MLIYHCGRLRAAVAIRAVEIEGGDAMLAEGAFECGAAVHRFGCVISHIFIVVLLTLRVLGNRCATLEQETLSLAGSGAGIRKLFTIAQATGPLIDPRRSYSERGEGFLFTLQIGVATGDASYRSVSAAGFVGKCAAAVWLFAVTPCPVPS